MEEGLECWCIEVVIREVLREREDRFVCTFVWRLMCLDLHYIWCIERLVVHRCYISINWIDCLSIRHGLACCCYP